MKLEILSSVEKCGDFEYITRITFDYEDKITIVHSKELGKTTLKRALRDVGANVIEDWEEYL